MAIRMAQATRLGKDRVRKASTDAEHVPVIADHVVRSRNLNRDIDRMREMDHLHGRAKANLLRQRRRLAHQELRHRHHINRTNIQRLSMVLADPSITKTKLISKHDLVKILLIGLSSTRMPTKTIRPNP